MDTTKQQQQPIQQQQQQTVDYNNLAEVEQQGILKNDKGSRKSKPYVKILEQPASKALRFRYECEGRSAGSIPGVNSTPENKTYPTIEIVGYKGRAVVVVSCVTKDPPHRPHPHNLVGKDGCRKGVCTMEINSNTMQAVFSNLGIQCVKKKDIEAALKAREDIRVDPYKTGFTHRFQPSSIDLNSVRLCFQVFMESEQKGRFTQPLTPVVTDPIFDKKAMSDLVICRLSSCTSSVLGNTQIILLCEKVAKEDIAVRFYEEKQGHVVWEGYGDFQHTDVHKQAAITFKTPRYHTLDVTDPVKVFIQLKRPSDGVTSDPLPFEYKPLDSGRHLFWNSRRNLKRKPDLDIVQQILEISPDNDHVIDLNTPTSEQPFNKNNNDSNNNNTLTTIDSTAMLTNDMNHNLGINREAGMDSKLPSAQEIDSIIEEKVRELEQQQQSQIEHHIDPLHEVTDLINQNAPKPIEADNSNTMAEVPQFSVTDKIHEWMKCNEFRNAEDGIQNANIRTVADSEDKTLNELLDQVAELDEIYTERLVERDNYSRTLLSELNGMDTCAPNEILADGGQTSMEVDGDDGFDDAATYSSLQIAFKNPINIPIEDLLPRQLLPTANLLLDEQSPYESVEVKNIAQAPPRPPPPATKLNSPHMHIPAAGEEKVPPLPPKRLRKQDSDAENRSIEANIGDTSEHKPRQPPPPIIIMKTPDHSPLSKRFPPKQCNATCNTLPKPKKPGFFTKLFSRRKSKTDLSEAAEQVTGKSTSKTTSPTLRRDLCLGNYNNHINTDLNRSSFRSIKSLQPVSLPTSPIGTPQKLGKPVGRSASSISGKRPAHLDANVIHIPLKEDNVHSMPHHEEYSQASTLTISNTLDRRTASALQLADIPICDGNMELIAIADRQSLRNLCENDFNVQLDPNIDLTEAEHYALYTSIPPQATISEFDETSAYYAPVEAGEILTPEQVADRLVAANHEGHLKRKRKKTNEDARGVVVDQHKIQHHQIKHSDAHVVESVAAWNERDVLSIKRVKENVVCWNPTKISAIKTEPTDSTPQSFVLHNLTPSPQSLSPHNYPNHRIVSPYNIRNVDSYTSTGQPLQTAIVGGQSSANYNPPMPGYSLTPESTYFMGNHFEGCVINQGIRNFSSGALGGTHSNWCLNQQTPPPAHPSSLPQNQYNTMRPGAGENCDNIENLSSQQEHGLTNLLNIDSNLLVHIDSKDQDMLKLNTEELQLSNLSISS